MFYSKVAKMGKFSQIWSHLYRKSALKSSLSNEKPTLASLFLFTHKSHNSSDLLVFTSSQHVCYFEVISFEAMVFLHLGRLICYSQYHVIDNIIVSFSDYYSRGLYPWVYFNICIGCPRLVYPFLTILLETTGFELESLEKMASTITTELPPLLPCY